MKKLAWGLLLLLLACAPARAQGIGPQVIACNKSFSVVGPQSITANVAASGKTITWCGWAINGGSAAGTAQLTYGTGTNCNVGNTPITPLLALAISQAIIDHQNWGFVSLPMNNDLCLTTTGTGVQIQVYYSVN